MGPPLYRSWNVSTRIPRSLSASGYGGETMGDAIERGTSLPDASPRLRMSEETERRCERSELRWRREGVHNPHMAELESLGMTPMMARLLVPAHYRPRHHEHAVTRCQVP